MTNRFDNTGDGDQNIAQGDGAVGKQENSGQEVDGDGHIFSGTGDVTVNQGLQLTPRTVIIASMLAAGVIGTGLAGWYWLAPPSAPVANTLSTTGGQAPAIIAKRDATLHYNGIDAETFARYTGELAVTDAALTSFFKILEEQSVPRSDLDAKLREIAGQYKKLLTRLETVQSADPEVVRLKKEAQQAIKGGEYPKAEELLEKVAIQYSLSAAATYAELAELQEVQLRYAKAAEYWQKAAALLPEGEKKDRPYYLNQAGCDLHRIARYTDALPLFEQSLTSYREIGDRKGEGTLLNNISQIYKARGDYDTALKYLEQNLVLFREIGDKEYEGGTLNNISLIYDARGDYDTALKYLEQSLDIHREIGDKAGEGTTLNNISLIYKARGDYDTALKYLKQSLVICREIGDKRQEAITSWNIGFIYKEQGDLAKAEQYISRAVQLAEEIGHPKLEEWRETLAELQAEIKGQ